MSGFLGVLDCASALLRYRPLAMAAAFFPWIYLVAAISVFGYLPGIGSLFALIAALGMAFCITVVGGAYAAIAFPGYAPPSNIRDEARTIGIALAKTLLIALILALESHYVGALVGFSWWKSGYGISSAVMVLCLTFFVAENHVKQRMSIRRVRGIFTDMPLVTILTIVFAAVAALGIDLVQDRVRPLRTAVGTSQSGPAVLRWAFLVFYVAIFAYARILIGATLFVSLYAYWHNLHGASRALDRLPRRADV